MATQPDNGILDLGDLTPIEVPVLLGGKRFVLREASGEAGCKYRNAMLNCTQLGPDGRPASIRGLADVEPLLVSLCLFDEQGKAVLLGTIRGWPARIQKALFEQAKFISGLQEGDVTEDQAKKVPADTTGGSA